jgi:tetratricopeptide (TPR) repeat protein
MTGLEKGKSLFEKQEFKWAIKELNIFLVDNINNADALYTRAICYRKTAQFDLSIQDFTTILSRLPNEPTLLCDRGISHFHNKDIPSAMKDMDKAVEIDPNNPYRYSSRAYIRSRSDIDGAILDYEKAIELDPKDEISYNNLGLLQENAGRMKAAKKNYTKGNNIIGYNPENRKERLDAKAATLDANDKKPALKEHINNLEVQENQASLWETMCSVFTSKLARKEYLLFVKSFFKK